MTYVDLQPLKLLKVGLIQYWSNATVQAQVCQHKVKEHSTRTEHIIMSNSKTIRKISMQGMETVI